MRLQDKGNRFVVTDKETDKIKAQELRVHFKNLIMMQQRKIQKSLTMERKMVSEKKKFERMEGLYCSL